LKEQGFAWNNFEIKLLPSSVFLKIKPYAEIRIPCNTFKRFAEWYLEDQEDPCTCEMHDRVYYGCRCSAEKQPNRLEMIDDQEYLPTSQRTEEE
jgi:hypothetical protein